MSAPGENSQPPKSTAPNATGDGIRSVRTTSVFRLLNFELYAKPNKIIMALGLISITGVFGYISYMRYKYEKLGYYTAVQEDGKEVFLKKQSKWET